MIFGLNPLWGFLPLLLYIVAARKRHECVGSSVRNSRCYFNG